MTCEKCDDTGIIYGAVIREGVGWLQNNDKVCDCAAGQSLRFDYSPQFGEEE